MSQLALGVIVVMAPGARSGRAARARKNRYAIAFAVFFGWVIAAVAPGASMTVRSATPA